MMMMMTTMTIWRRDWNCISQKEAEIFSHSFHQRIFSADCNQAL